MQKSYQPNCLLRERDVFIMDEIMDNISSPTTQEIVNRVRIWMRVTTLSHITTADGSSIRKCFWKGEKQYDSRLLWPHQTKPSKKAFKVWRRCISSTFLSDPTTKATKQRNRLDLHTPLGTWLHAARKTFTNFSDFFSPTTQSIYIFHPDFSLYQQHEKL